MNVRELIAHLEKLPPHCEVLVNNLHEGEVYPLKVAPFMTVYQDVILEVDQE